MTDRSLRMGFQVWGQFVGWNALMRAGREVERLGFDGLWANDHFYPIAGDGGQLITGQEGPVIEAWMTLAGWAAVTSRVRLGCLVSGAGYRNGGLLVKMATALDHMSAGRAVLGIGAGWHEREHRAFGFGYPPLGGRLDRLEEMAELVRGLLDGETMTMDGHWVASEAATNDPPPVQRRLPLLLGGSGERRTLPVVARFADEWNGEGDPDAYARKNALLDELCAAAGREPTTVARSVGLPPVCIRDTRDEAIAVLASILGRHQPEPDAAVAWAAASPFATTEAGAIELLGAYRDAGAGEVMFDWPAPFDGETLERLAGPVRAALAAPATPAGATPARTNAGIGSATWL
jgi:alkanesulfonate monooxygenase SsuD/methylene tetrahydromethanopterin reductase-like flavin-dependent oxidoreductase (luciferase family)